MAESETPPPQSNNESPDPRRDGLNSRPQKTNVLCAAGFPLVPTPFFSHRLLSSRSGRGLPHPTLSPHRSILLSSRPPVEEDHLSPGFQLNELERTRSCSDTSFGQRWFFRSLPFSVAANRFTVDRVVFREFIRTTNETMSFVGELFSHQILFFGCHVSD